jgi:hypothetical protein
VNAGYIFPFRKLKAALCGRPLPDQRCELAFDLAQKTRGAIPSVDTVSQPAVGYRLPAQPFKLAEVSLVLILLKNSEEISVCYESERIRPLKSRIRRSFGQINSFGESLRPQANIFDIDGWFFQHNLLTADGRSENWISAFSLKQPVEHHCLTGKNWPISDRWLRAVSWPIFATCQTGQSRRHGWPTFLEAAMTA